MKRWDRMTDEEKAEKLAELQEKWPSMRNDHPRQEGLPDYNSWKKIDLEFFILRMDKPLFMSWLEFKKEYENQKFTELEEKMNTSRFWKNYGEKFPYVFEIISELVNSRRMNFEKTQEFIRLLLDNFRSDGWPIRRGEEE